MEKLEFMNWSHPPCGSGTWPDEVLRPKGFNIPMLVALTTDKRTLLLLDSVDNCFGKELTKKQALELADQFRQLAEAMAE
jgi:hypothetical protein